MRAWRGSRKESETAQALREVIRRAQAELEAWWNTPLSLSEAGTWGGHSVSQLRRLIREGKNSVAPAGGIRRRDVPVHPGHAHDAPRIDPAWLEQERNRIGDWWFRQEYLCEFVETTDQVFGYDEVMRAVSSDVPALFPRAA